MQNRSLIIFSILILLATTGYAQTYEIKKLKEKIEELIFIKEFQQDVIADFEVTTGLSIAKKSLPETLLKEIEKKKKDLLKSNGSPDVSE